MFLLIHWQVTATYRLYLLVFVCATFYACLHVFPIDFTCSSHNVPVIGLQHIMIQVVPVP
jgi:hypothetical protein